MKWSQVLDFFFPEPPERVEPIYVTLAAVFFLFFFLLLEKKNVKGISLPGRKDLVKVNQSIEFEGFPPI